MKVLVLAAGRSKRMKPVNDKNFLNFLGKSLIEWQMETLSKAGFKDVILVGGSHNIGQFKILSEKLPLDITIVEQKNLDELPKPRF